MLLTSAQTPTGTLWDVIVRVPEYEDDMLTFGESDAGAISFIDGLDLDVAPDLLARRVGPVLFPQYRESSFAGPVRPLTEAREVARWWTEVLAE